MLNYLPIGTVPFDNSPYPGPFFSPPLPPKVKELFVIDDNAELDIIYDSKQMFGYELCEAANNTLCFKKLEHHVELLLSEKMYREYMEWLNVGALYTVKAKFYTL